MSGNKITSSKELCVYWTKDALAFLPNLLYPPPSHCVQHLIAISSKGEGNLCHTENGGCHHISERVLFICRDFHHRLMNFNTLKSKKEYLCTQRVQPPTFHPAEFQTWLFIINKCFFLWKLIFVALQSTILFESFKNASLKVLLKSMGKV